MQDGQRPAEVALSASQQIIDTVLDRSLVLGFSKLGYLVRRRWWSVDDPERMALRGRAVVVTGANSGLGMAAAAGCAKLGARVYMLVRDLDRGRHAAEAIRVDVPEAELTVLACDVSDSESIRRCVASIRLQVDRIHGLVHNAGVLPATRSEAPDGHELTLSTHVLGPLLLTGLLRAELVAAGDARVALVSSGGMLATGVEAADPEYRRGSYRGATAYARTKRLQVAFAPILARRLEPDGVAVYAMHPGWADTPGLSQSLPGFHRMMAPLLRTPDQAADTVVWLMATRPAPPSGSFWHDRRRRPTHMLPFQSDDPVKVRAVWDYCRATLEVGGHDRVW